MGNMPLNVECKEISVLAVWSRILDLSPWVQGRFSQETFTKIPFSVEHTSYFDAEMKKTALAKILISALLCSAAVVAHLVESGKANPYDLPVDTSISVYSQSYVPYQDVQCESCNVTLTIQVILVYDQDDPRWPDKIHLDGICYILDGHPLVYVHDFTVEDYVDYGRDKQDFLMYTALVRLEDLSEGNHTVTAYANDTRNAYAYINHISSSYNFTVNSTQQTPPTPTPIPETKPFPIVLLIGSIIAIMAAAIGLGFLVYLKKRHKLKNA